MINIISIGNFQLIINQPNLLSFQIYTFIKIDLLTLFLQRFFCVDFLFPPFQLHCDTSFNLLNNLVSDYLATTTNQRFINPL